MKFKEFMNLPIVFIRNGEKVGNVSDLFIDKNLKIQIDDNKFITSEDIFDCNEDILLNKNLPEECDKPINKKPDHFHTMINTENLSAEVMGHYWWLRIKNLD